MAYVDFLSKVHTSTQRDYLQRVLEHDKAKCAEVAIRYGQDYWDGDRKHGYGGYYYDGRWNPVARDIAEYYGIKPGAKILDVGCGKGFLLYEFTQIIPEINIAGIDLSEYALANAKEEIQPFLQLGNATSLPFPDNEFDLVICITTLHNLYNYELRDALREIERVGKGKNKYIVVESYRTEAQKANFLYWQLTCRSFYKPEEWEWLMNENGYSGDYSCIVFD